MILYDLDTRKFAIRAGVSDPGIVGVLRITCAVEQAYIDVTLERQREAELLSSAGRRELQNPDLCRV